MTPLHRIISITSLVAAFAVSGISASAACLCPFCDAPVLTLSEQLAESEHVFLARWLGGQKATIESAGTAEFEIIDVHKTRGDLYSTGAKIVIPQYVAGKSDARYVIFGGDGPAIDWPIPSEVTEDGWEYITGLPLPTTDPERQAERLAYFIPYFEHPELLISNDAYGEFAGADYDVIKQLRDRLPRKQLAGWIIDPDAPATRLGLYGLLLGLCGGPEEAAVMRQKIVVPDSDFRLGIEGVMSGYVMIAGVEGLRVLEDTKMRATTYTNAAGEEVTLPFSETYATMSTLRFLWTYEPDVIPAERLKASMRILLDNNLVADMVIRDLARWKDWSLAEQLMTMFDSPEAEPHTKRAIVNYFIAASRSAAPETPEDEMPEHVKAARKNLEMLEEKDPRTVQQARDSFF